MGNATSLWEVYQIGTPRIAGKTERRDRAVGRGPLREAPQAEGDGDAATEGVVAIGGGLLIVSGSVEEAGVKAKEHEGDDPARVDEGDVEGAGVCMRRSG